MRTLVVFMDMFHQEAKQLGGGPGTEGHGLEAAFFFLFS